MGILQSGDTLYIREGTYAEAIRTSTTGVPSGTSWSNSVTVAGYPSETVILTGDGVAAIDLSSGSGVSYVIFKDFTIDVSGGNIDTIGVYAGTSVHHIRFQNMEVRSRIFGTGTTSAGANAFAGGGNFIEVLNCNIHNFQDYGFYVRGQNWLIDKNQIHHNGGYGVQIYDSGQSNVNNNVVSNNKIYANGSAFFITTYALVLSSGSNNIACNNIIYGQVGGSGNGGIQVAYTNGGTNNQVYNNTVYGNPGNGIDIFAGASGTVVKNNIVYGNGGGISDAGTGTVLSNNVTTDPQFVNASANDFSLRASSPAINAGVTVSIVTTDMNGVARPQGAAYDVGAYEYSQETTPLPAPSNLRAVVQ
jgi:parallel beta-helix repeat protein